MKLNTARLVVDTARKRPGKRIGAMLRPCEMRALNEMAARGAVKRDDVLAVCTDCLGTFPADEFEWRTERSAKGLTKETLQFAPQGGISAYRYRPACQMCAEPGATEGDVNIGVFGLPVRQSMLVNAHNGSVVLKSITDGLATDDLVGKRRADAGKDLRAACPHPGARAQEPGRRTCPLICRNCCCNSKPAETARPA